MTARSGADSILALAADNPSRVLELLQADPSLASIQDENGYSLVHAAASYDHLDLLRALVNTYHVSVNIKDADAETALYGVETVETAKVLVEELKVDIFTVGWGGRSAREVIADENEYPQVAVYLRMKELESQSGEASSGDPVVSNGTQPPPPLPEGMSIDFGTMAPEEAGEVVDPEFRRRIEELAAREDFEGADGQEALRNLVAEALRGEVGQEREVRQRTS